MPKGTLEVLLVGCKGLEDADFLDGIDPYVVLTYRTQEQKSSVSSSVQLQDLNLNGTETFVFTIGDDVSELTLKIMDKDAFTNDDYLGEATVPLEPLFIEGSLSSNSIQCC
ncbi:elicitor-responsive protein 3 [Melia azedarach]|uniref:Elicitor-responsive protein 3 n=1 Tax=Melia azedarach TaxID=155640 RepID=A0ACC1YVE1_MELAZ|nr:elicitor-responsive protein 3 [Melia azedarach]